MNTKNIEKKLEKLENKSDNDPRHILVIYDPEDPKKGADQVPPGYEGAVFMLPDNGRDRVKG